MSTNAGEERIDEEGEWKERGQSYVCPTALTDIVSISDVVKKGFRVCFDLDIKNTFYVYKKDAEIRFPYDEKGLYKRSDEGSADYRVLATEVEGFTQREVERAKAARQFYHDLNAESPENMRAFIRGNIAKNVPISTEDMNLAEKIYGPDVPTCKGKWTKRKPKIVKDKDTIDLLPELRIKGMETELAIDMVYINDKAFLHILNRKIKCLHTVVLGTCAKGQAYDKEVLLAGLNHILHKLS